MEVDKKVSKEKEETEVQKKCKHRDSMIMKSFRPNKRYGKTFTTLQPKKCKKVCTKCGKVLGSWKPTWGENLGSI